MNRARQHFRKFAAFGALALGFCWQALAQGTFINMDFEHPILPLTPEHDGMVPTANAIPGWEAYLDGVEQPSIVYDTIGLDSASISLYDRKSPDYLPLRGNYSVLLKGPTQFAPQIPVAIGQTGLIPGDAKSLVFCTDSLGLGTLTVSFAGQALQQVPLQSYANYRTVGMDIRPFAGQTGELLFSAYPGMGGGFVDNIHFFRPGRPRTRPPCPAGAGRRVFRHDLSAKKRSLPNQTGELIE